MKVIMPNPKESRKFCASLKKLETMGHGLTFEVAGFRDGEQYIILQNGSKYLKPVMSSYVRDAIQDSKDRGPSAGQGVLL